MIDISVEEFFEKQNAVPVDVRSPEEYEEGTIPGAINVPLFNNIVRKEIGTIYKQVGQDHAKWRAMELVSPYIPTLLSQIKELTKNGLVPVLFCWRGGMRSRAVATFLEFSGIPVYRIEGGYRAYRQYILEQIPSIIPNKAVVLHGMTGVGKTDILIKLQEQGYPVLDLEGIAAHKGSIFGAMGNSGGGNNQKTFDALLFSRLKELKESSFLIVEAESKRIGKVTQPQELLDKKIGGLQIYIHASIASRVERIYREYVEPYYLEQWFYDQVKEKMSVIQKRIKDLTIRAAIIEELENRNYKQFIKLLLEYYYDPRYTHKLFEYGEEFIHINTDNQAEVINEIATIIDQSFSKLHP
ncbi:MAG: tRNA 2-selenouridine synthase [Bacillus sp. (in: firmicutes)]|nr:tRNA 2-selenouridine synthase [Bacillus sp. (in: firmicutes)]